jgi:hypothetical protein
MKRLLTLAVALTTLSAMAVAGGLDVGSSVSAFYVQDVTGPAAGSKLCYRCRYGNRPVVSIFTRNVNREVAALIKEVDAVVGKNEDKDMAAFVVLLTDEPTAEADTLKKVAEEGKLAHTPLTMFEGVAGPPAYQLSHDAEVTVMMWVESTLKVNKTFKAAELTKDRIAAVLSEASQILN